MQQEERLEIGEREINLTQVLKLIGWVGNGGEAKALISGGFIRVNGEVELRKRRNMLVGDKVELLDRAIVVLHRV